MLSGIKKKKTNHKYIERISVNGKFRYFYDTDELKAYLSEKKGQVTDSFKKATGLDKREDVKIAEQKLKVARQKQSEAWQKSGRSIDAALKVRDKDDSLAYVQSVRDRASKDYENLLKENKKLDEANHNYHDAITEYNKTKLSKVEKFAKNPIKNTAEAIDAAADDVKWTVDDTVSKIADKRREKALAKDPKVVSAAKAKQQAQREYDRVAANFRDYCAAAELDFVKVLNGYTDDPVAIKMKNQYWKVNDDLRSAYLDYNTATRRYGVKPEFSYEYTDHF